MGQGLFLFHIRLQDTNSPASFTLLDVQSGPLSINVAAVLREPRWRFGLGLAKITFSFNIIFTGHSIESPLVIEFICFITVRTIAIS